MMDSWASQAIAAGWTWDAVRMPLDTGRSLHAHLAAAADTRDRLGPIAECTQSGVTYWLITTGSTDTWPPGCRLLTRGSWIVLPGPYVHAHWARWLHKPDSPKRLTGATWLAAALHDHHAPEALR